jgi:hypothetical protein
MRIGLVGIVALVLAVRLLTKPASSRASSHEAEALRQKEPSGRGLAEPSGLKLRSPGRMLSSTRLGHAPHRAPGTIATSSDENSEYLKQHCGYYLKQSFSSLSQRDALFQFMLRSDVLGCGCWLRMRPYACHYADRNPLYSAGTGASVEGSPEQCEALRQARLDRLSRIWTLESRQLIRAQQQAALQDAIARREVLTSWRQVRFPRRYAKKKRNTPTQ